MIADVDPGRVRLGIIGLGYVGMPLAVEFGKRISTLGFDVSQMRIQDLRNGIDATREVEPDMLAAAHRLRYSNDPVDLAACNTYIVAVPTPIDGTNSPDLDPLKAASRTVGGQLAAGDVVIFESTVYPGMTEEVCVPILEAISGLVFNRDFTVGYSPERINPGDKQHRLPDIIKVTSGSTPETAAFVDQLYKLVIRAGTYPAPSIKVAEAAKVIENTQRDLNIALINELALIFDLLDIDTEQVLKTAGTKWNFLDFRPGLVGGHCIGVDPYYLTHKAQQVGYHPEIILAGRRINDRMGAYIASRVVKLMMRKKIHVADSNILVLGLTFKENCPDLRNTRVVDIINELKTYHANVEVHDPWCAAADASREYGIDLINQPAKGRYDAVILAVAHDQFKELGVNQIRTFTREDAILFDVKQMFKADQVDARL